ncbi:GAF domain-containing protein [Conexibacter sp. CPCC 206217]|uniref:GAF domain-containing protein n=1 Tax=Conexibacter sp. CPCC 206217 TaxID=3064574 RepID=UPI00271C306F|nr:GAF domain-containing protein [Conexibacter sp. CPCC 206217]MDO8212565.1 GAF domain-containing protein [Conexibacter sp. CPCC 206217]
MSGWAALRSGADPRAHARALARTREHVLAGGTAPATVRPVIAASWRRALRRGIDADGGLPTDAVGSEEAAARWERHRLAPALPAIRAVLSEARRQTGHVALVCDRDGTLLWLEGEAQALEIARAVRLEPGTSWSERSAGTNAMGTALVAGHPLQVFSSEHFLRAAGSWVCSAAPIHDPADGALLGVVDLSGDARTAHPLTLAIVRAAAAAAAADLRRLDALRAAEPERRGVVPEAADGRARRLRGESPGEAHAAAVAGELRIEALGRDRVRLGGAVAPLELSPRQGELLMLLLLRPGGWSAEQLALELLGEGGRPVSVRAGLSRLRRLLGERLGARPYRLRGGASVDLFEVEAAIERGDLETARARCAGRLLLPQSHVPAIVAARRRLELRLGVATDGDRS